MDGSRGLISKLMSSTCGGSIICHYNSNNFLRRYNSQFVSVKQPIFRGKILGTQGLFISLLIITSRFFCKPFIPMFLGVKRNFKYLLKIDKLLFCFAIRT